MGFYFSGPERKKYHDKADRGYEKAYQHYERQKHKFLKKMYLLGNETEQNILKNFILHANTEIQSISPEELFDTKAMKNFKKDIEKYSEQLLKSSNNKSLIDLLEEKYKSGRTKEDHSRYLKNFDMRIKNDLNALLLTSGSVEQELKQIYIKAFGENSLTTGSEQGLYAFFRRELITQFIKSTRQKQINNSLNGYTKLFRGYYREKLAEQSIQRVLGELQAKQVGDIKVEGQQSSIDILIGQSVGKMKDEQLLKILTLLEKLNGIGTAEMELLKFTNSSGFFGVQSKSWVMPEDIKMSQQKRPNTFYDLGNHDNLLKSFPVLNSKEFNINRGWHNNIYLLSKNITKVLGYANVLYATGAPKFYWTSDLIVAFRSAAYYLSFYYKHHNQEYEYPATSQVVWLREEKFYT